MQRVECSRLARPPTPVYRSERRSFLPPLGSLLCRIEGTTSVGHALSQAQENIETRLLNTSC